jgi:predicted nuclease of predicted toxin-antitoxin system
MSRNLSKDLKRNSRIRIYADESVNVDIVEGLKRRGVDAFSARDASKLGLTDEEQLEFAMKNRAVIFTHDVDFLTMALDREHHGIIYVHQRKVSVGGCVRRLKTIVEVKTSEEMRNQVVFL